MKNTATIYGGVLVIVAAILWSIDGVFLRPSLYVLDPQLVVFIEHTLGSCLFLYTLYIGRSQIKRIPKKVWGALLWVSFFGGVLGTLYITKAFFMAFAQEVSFATVIILQKLQPLFALSMAALLLREALPKRFYMRAFLAVIAGYVLAFGFNIDVYSIDWTNTAATYALVAAFAFGSSTVMGKYIVGHIDATHSAGLRFLLTTIMMGGFLLVSTGGIDVTAIGVGQWYTFGAIVVSSGALALFLYYTGLQKITASQATILELARPLSAVVLDWMINGNVLSIEQYIAAGVMIYAMTMIGLYRYA